ncbi:MAG TPA: PHP domain-containing protein [Spongiibacteraceae bacterium]|nr:PHP domain-containing protein [Spongiibacteraceae bacterium]
MRVDLHSHTNASDGKLSPEELCQHALRCGVDLLAITDHDSVGGYRQARAWLGQRRDLSLQLLPAVEYSSVWSSVGVHVVGLGIDSDHPATVAACQYYSEARLKRAQMIGDRLAKLGMPGAAEGALALAGSAQVGRPHFARYLVMEHHVRTEDEAFDRYLGAGKPGDIKLLWPELKQVIEWIRAAGGIATLAHPLKYRLTATRVRRLVAEFAVLGGRAMEVVVGRQTAQDSHFLAQLASQHQLLASVGSDFHGVSMYGAQLGEVSDLPKICVPVWRDWMRNENVANIN